MDRRARVLCVDDDEESRDLLVFVKGAGQFIVGRENACYRPGRHVPAPAGTEHDFTNSGDEALKLFTVYSPREHSDGIVHVTKADALAHPDE